ncbi:hypothetical protein HRS9122_03780 [Pyrenophora teres f. teres]|nr:hypothetical protein HRS9122_03780 [Pyrenophora teres f. teres]
MSTQPQYSSGHLNETQRHLLSPTLSSPGFSSGYHSPLMHQGPPSPDFNAIKKAQKEDARLKSLIRRLRIISRTLAFLLSLGVLIPITLTLTKFLSTKDTYRTVTLADGTSHTRTAWAKNTRPWPTYMYFSVAVVSTVLHAVTLLAYCCSVGKANTVNTVTSVFSLIVMLGNVGVWAAAVGVYRMQKDWHGISNDLWGWTCSHGASKIQVEFEGVVDFEKYCSVQSVSWFVGLAQAGAAVLTVVIYVLVWARRRSKKELKRMSKGQYDMMDFTMAS